MSKKDAAMTRKIVQLERAAHLNARFHDELCALPPSLRVTRLLRLNRNAAARIVEQTEKARQRVSTRCTPAAAS